MKIVILSSHGAGKTTLTRQLHSYLKKEYEMKIGVTGAHSTGKTTLSTLLTGRLTWQAPMQAYLKGFSMNETTSLESEWWVIAKQLEMKLLTPDSWIADKCLIDILAYAYYLFPEEKDFLKVAEKVIKPNINYDLVFYLPCGEFPIVDDSFRSLDPQFQKAIDKTIIKVMADAGVAFCKIVGTQEERFKEAKKMIDKKFNL